jgi:mannose-1-phosphate guanylyltransferase
MHAIILVGGRGTRLQPLTDTRPKPMLPIVDRPFLEWQLEHLKAHGVTAVTFACGFLPDAIQAHFGDGEHIGIKLTYAIEPEPLDTAGAIAFAARTLEPQRLLVCNGDVLTELDISQLVREHERRSAVATIALTPVDEPSRYGLVLTDEEGAVMQFLEKPAPEECGDNNLINAGTYVLEPAVFDLVPEGVRCNIEREVFPKLVGKGLYALGFHGYWNDIGTIESYVQANIDVLTGAFGDAVHPGDVWIAPDAIVHPDATVGRGSIISHGTVIEANADVAQALILEHVTVGAGATVRGAIIGEGATVDPGANIAQGTVIAPVA